jgi:hypothetical protein
VETDLQGGRAGGRLGSSRRRPWSAAGAWGLAARRSTTRRGRHVRVHDGVRGDDSGLLRGLRADICETRRTPSAQALGAGDVVLAMLVARCFRRTSGRWSLQTATCWRSRSDGDPGLRGAQRLVRGGIASCRAPTPASRCPGLDTGTLYRSVMLGFTAGGGHCAGRVLELTAPGATGAGTRRHRPGDAADTAIPALRGCGTGPHARRECWWRRSGVMFTYFVVNLWMSGCTPTPGADCGREDKWRFPSPA